MPKKALLISLLICAWLNLPAIADTRPAAVAFMYHHFGEARYPSTNIRLEQFEAHLDYLAHNNFQVLPLAEVLSAIQQRTSLPARTVVITMDDAYRSVYTEAYPRLKARGWPFTVFVSSDYIDKGYSNYMTWQQMQEMAEHGASYGNHTRSHAYLVRRLEGESEDAWRTRIHDDLAFAQTRLEEILGDATLKIIAYPYGEYDDGVREITQKLGLIGMGQHSGAIGPLSDFLALPRFPMAESFGALDDFKTKALSLPLAIESVTPAEPTTELERPAITVQLAASDARLKQLACYASGQGKMEISWQDERSFSIQAAKPLPAGRSRYNCTAPSAEGGRFYWFSQPWIRPGGVDGE